MIEYTRVIKVDRFDSGVQVSIIHGFWGYYEKLSRNGLSVGRTIAQIAWARARLAERGDTSVERFGTARVQRDGTETIITFTNENMELAS